MRENGPFLLKFGGLNYSVGGKEWNDEGMKLLKVYSYFSSNLIPFLPNSFTPTKHNITDFHTSNSWSQKAGNSKSWS